MENEPNFAEIAANDFVPLPAEQIELLRQKLRPANWAEPTEGLRVTAIVAAQMLSVDKGKLIAGYREEDTAAVLTKALDSLRDWIEWLDNMREILEAAEARLIVAGSAAVVSEEKTQ